MTFGKRQQRLDGRQGTVAESRDVQNRGALFGLLGVGGLALLLTAGLLSVGMVRLGGYLLDMSLNRHFETKLASPAPTSFEQLIMDIEGPSDPVERAIHKECHAIATRKLTRQSPYREIWLENWATLGSAGRVPLIADYVACSVARKPERFCDNAARDRMVTLVTGYYGVQAKEQQIFLEDTPAIGAPGFAADPKTDVKALFIADRRIVSAVVLILDKGYARRSDFRLGPSDVMPPALYELLARMPPQQRSCPDA